MTQLRVPEQFGMMQGMKFLTTGVYIAEPFAPVLAGEHGALVVNLERPGEGDPWRNTGYKFKTASGGVISADWSAERHNEYFITLDLSKPEGRDIFLGKLLPQFDVWMESSKPGTLDKWGITDAEALKHNPKLVICHVSGYGQWGRKDYQSRPSFDAIAQAFGGLMSLTGLPEPHPPIRTNPWFGDFITALHAMSATMAAYIHAQKTGEGQVVDVPQFEVIQRHMGPVESVYFKENKVLKRRGNRDVTVNTQPYDSYEALDGWIVISATERAEFDAVCRVMEQDPKRWAKAFDNPDSDVGREFDHTLRSWVNQRAAVEVVLLMNEAGVPCSKVMSAADIAEDPHYQARGVYQEWPAVDLGKKIKGMGAYPKVQEMPGKVWRGSAGIGYDNEQVYTSLVGLTKQQFEELRGKKII